MRIVISVADLFKYMGHYNSLTLRCFVSLKATELYTLYSEAQKSIAQHNTVYVVGFFSDKMMFTCSGQFQAPKVFAVHTIIFIR